MVKQKTFDLNFPPSALYHFPFFCRWHRNCFLEWTLCGNNKSEIPLSNPLHLRTTDSQYCQMVHFQTKIPNLGKFWKAFCLLYCQMVRMTTLTGELTRVTRWVTFKPKIPIWVNFWGFFNGRCWYILCPFGQFSDNLVHFVCMWYIFPVLVCCTENIWQPLWQSL
jgi:hypothetical protein